MSSQVSQCSCGAKAVHPQSGTCHACYQRSWSAKRKVAGASMWSSKTAGVFDWECVRRAWDTWAGFGGPEPGRILTRAERIYLCYHALAAGRYGVNQMRELLGLDYEPAVAMIRQMRSGEIEVRERGPLGQELHVLPRLDALAA